MSHVLYVLIMFFLHIFIEYRPKLYQIYPHCRFCLIWDYFYHKLSGMSHYSSLAGKGYSSEFYNRELPGRIVSTPTLWIYDLWCDVLACVPKALIKCQSGVVLDFSTWSRHVLYLSSSVLLLLAQSSDIDWLNLTLCCGEACGQIMWLSNKSSNKSYLCL